jgi:hypothetical protein
MQTFILDAESTFILAAATAVWSVSLPRLKTADVAMFMFASVPQF